MSSTKTVDKNGWKRDAPWAAKEDALHVLERKLRVLLIYRKMIPSIRLCGHCQMEYLAGQGVVEYRALQEMKLKSSDLNWADIVLLGRLDSWYEYQLTKKLREAGKYLIYIIDDDLLNIPSEISSAAYYGKKKIQGYIRGMIEISDTILSPSPLLLQKYAVHGRKAIQIEEPAIAPAPYKPRDLEKPVKIGFAGSIDRTGDVENILKDVMLRIKREYGDRVKFEFFGAIPSFAKELGARCIPYCDSYNEYRRKLNSLEWDIGLAPMPDTPFHACKHYNKFMEYAAAGCLGVFSKVRPYLFAEQYIDAQCLVDNDSSAWVKILRELVDNGELREKLRRETIQILSRELKIEDTAKRLWQEMKDIVKAPCIKRKLNVWLMKYKINACIRFGLVGIRMYGSNPKVAFYRVVQFLRDML